MPTPLSDEQLAAMTERDEAAGNGYSAHDPMVFTDRHELLAEVARLRQVLARVKSGRPTSTS